MKKKYFVVDENGCGMTIVTENMVWGWVVNEDGTSKEHPDWDGDVLLVSGTEIAFDTRFDVREG